MSSFSSHNLIDRMLCEESYSTQQQYVQGISFFVKNGVFVHAGDISATSTQNRDADIESGCTDADIDEDESRNGSPQPHPTSDQRKSLQNGTSSRDAFNEKSSKRSYRVGKALGPLSLKKRYSDHDCTTDQSDDSDACEDKCEAPKFRVSFHGSVRVVLIPTRSEYRQVGLSRTIWWHESDYSTFKREAVAELKAFMSAINSSDAKASLALLYQPTASELELAKAETIQHHKDGMIARDQDLARVLLENEVQPSSMPTQPIGLMCS
jgi:hypothetical protein